MKRPASSLLVMLIVVGVVMAGLGYVTGGSASVYVDRSGVHPVKPEEKRLLVEEQLQFSTLELNVSTADVRVVSGEKFKIDASYFDGQDPGYALEDGVLRVFDSGAISKPLRFTMGIYVATNEMTVTLPGGLRLERAQAHSDVGDMLLVGLDAASLEATAGTGKITMRDVRADVIRCSADVGDMTFERVEVAGHFNAESGTGRVTATKLTCADAEVRSDVGDIQLNEIVTGGLTAHGGTAGVRANGTLSGVTLITADVGRIELETSIERDQYRVEAKADVGSVRLTPEAENPATAPNQMTLKSGTGSIRAEFGK